MSNASRLSLSKAELLSTAHWDDTDLCVLIQKGDLPGVRHKVEKHGKDIVQHYDNIALEHACGHGHLDIVKYLVSVGAKVTAHKNGPATHASYGGYLEVLKYLVSQGADVTDNYNYALIFAARFGYLDVVKYLVSLGANVRDQNNKALKNARHEGNVEMEAYLLSQGAGTDTPDDIPWALLRATPNPARPSRQGAGVVSTNFDFSR